MREVDLIVRGGAVLTMDDHRTVHDTASLAIHDGRIEDIGTVEDIDSTFDSSRVLEARGHLVLPGFVNTHFHFFSTLVKNSPAMHDADLVDFLQGVSDPLLNATEQDIYEASRLACLEMIRTGCTFTVNMCPPTRAAEAESRASLRAMSESGIRGAEARQISNVDGADLGIPVLDHESPEQQIASTIKLRDEWLANDRVQVWFGPPQPACCSDELILAMASAASQEGIRITTHLHEESAEVEGLNEALGGPPLPYYQRLTDGALFGPHMLAVHCVWVNEDEIALLAASAANVSHNPVTNQYSAGTAPIPAMVQAGINVALGMDDCPINMFDTMKTTAMVHKVPSGDAAVLTADEVLEMATINGAKAVGLADEIGSLEVGKRADLVLFDLEQANTVPHDPGSYAYTVVYCGDPHNVSTVIIDGRVVMENRQILTVDEREVFDHVQAITDRLYVGANGR